MTTVLRAPARKHIAGTLAAALALTLIAPAAASAASAPLVAGSYNDAMLIGYDPATGVVSGYFDMQRGEQPSFSCIFYLHGKLAGGKAKVTTYFPKTPKDDVISGTLTLKDSKDFRVTLPTDHGGCGMVESFADAGNPAAFDLAAAYPWTSVAVVKSAKAYFYPAAGAAATARPMWCKATGWACAPPNPAGSRSTTSAATSPSAAGCGQATSTRCHRDGAG